MTSSLVGSEMCIRDRHHTANIHGTLELVWLKSPPEEPPAQPTPHHGEAHAAVVMPQIMADQHLHWGATWPGCWRDLEALHRRRWRRLPRLRPDREHR
eukprot:5120025-Prorocentrum_lima.AAC.1